MESGGESNVEAFNMPKVEAGRPCKKFHTMNPSSYTGYTVKRPIDYGITLVTSDHVEFQIQAEALTAISEYFAALLTSGMNEQLEQKVAFPDIDSRTLEHFLIFASTGCAIVGEDSFLPLLELGCRFQCNRLLDILVFYINEDFLHLKQEDISFVFTSRIHPGIADICRRLILENLIKQKMLNLSLEVVAGVLSDDDLKCVCEDDVFHFVKAYSDRWDLDTQQQLVLLNMVRLPRLTLSAFEGASATMPSLKNTETFIKFIDQLEFVQRVRADQLRPRTSHDVHVTMLWIGDDQSSPCGVFSVVNPLRLRAENALRKISPKRIKEGDSGFLRWPEHNLSIFNAYVGFANHLFSISSIDVFEKLTFNPNGADLNFQFHCHFQNLQIRNYGVVVGVDYELDFFYLSCVRNESTEKCIVLLGRLKDTYKIEYEQVELPACVRGILSRRMIYRRDAICMLKSDSELLLYTSNSDDIYKVPPADDFKPKYIEIAVQGDSLYVFDYAECPIEVHDFSQPFSRFDKIRVFSLSRKQWLGCYNVHLNDFRLSGYNELIDFSVEMYFIRKQLYLTWTYQSRLHIFRFDESAGCVAHLLNYRIPRDTNGVILLPSYYLSHKETTLLERYVQEKCCKLSTIESNEARLIAHWRDTILDGVIGSGLFPKAFCDV